jgi:flagellar motor protein MotB
MVNEKQPSEEIQAPLRRRRRSTMHHEDGEGWAVSYSDMLMVLMSFFIIFFNLDDSPPSHLSGLLENLRNDSLSFELKDEGESKNHDDLKLKAASKRSPASVIKESKTDGGALGKTLTNFFSGSSIESKDIKAKGDGSPNNLETMPTGLKGGIAFKKIEPKKLKDDKWSKILNDKESSNYKGGVVIDFRNNLYPLGQYELKKDSKKEIERVLKLIEPYKEGLSIVFIGHSDSVPVTSKRKTIDSNMILSTLRAAKAVEYAVEKGFDPLWVSSQGLAEYTRNTRSLSIRVMER